MIVEPMVPAPASVAKSRQRETTADPEPLYTAHFAFDADALRQVDADALRGLLPALDHARVTVVGHTDAIGPMAYNQLLALRRARAVAHFLVSLDVLWESVQVEGRGSCCYRASNETAAGRAANRRVEIFTSPAPAGSTSHPLD